MKKKLSDLLVPVDNRSPTTLMVSMLDSDFRGLGFRPGWDIVLCSLAEQFTLCPCPSSTINRH